MRRGAVKRGQYSGRRGGTHAFERRLERRDGLAHAARCHSRIGRPRSGDPVPLLPHRLPASFTVELGSLSAHAPSVRLRRAGGRGGCARRRCQARLRAAPRGLAGLGGGRPLLPPRRRGEPLSTDLGRRVRRLYPRRDGSEVRRVRLLAPAVPLLLRRTRDLELVLSALVVWAGAAAVVGVLQIFGVDIFDAWSLSAANRRFSVITTLRRSAAPRCSSPSTVLALRSDSSLPRWLLVTAGVGGAVGVTVSGSAAAGIGLAAATAGILIVGGYRRRLTVAPRTRVARHRRGRRRGHSRDARRRRRSIRALPRHPRARPSAQENVQTHVQRTMLAYIGWQVFLDHPIAGAGWQSSAKEEQVYGDYLDDARREFPDTPGSLPDAGAPVRDPERVCPGARRPRRDRLRARCSRRSRRGCSSPPASRCAGRPRPSCPACLPAPGCCS